MKILVSMFFAAATAVCTADIGNIKTSSTETPGILKITYELSEPAIVMMSVKTGGVAIAESRLAHLSGDVRRKVPAGNGTIYWAADRDLGAALPAGSEVELTPWALDAPPEVMVVDVRMPGNFTFYRSLDGLPDGGLKNDKYRTACMVMKKIPAKGVTFLCGKTGEGVADKYKPFLCTFTNDFYFGIYPVTQAQHLTVAGTTGSEPSSDPASHLHPVNKVNMIDLRYWSNWPQDGHNVQYRAISKWQLLGLKFDLPTSTQWEYACRAGGQGDYYNGKDASHLGEIAWYADNSDGTTHPVGLKEPNAWDLYDMIGNVNEWTLDRYRHTEVPDRETVKVDYPGPSNHESAYPVACTRRGGSCETVASSCAMHMTFNHNKDAGPYTFNGYRLCVPAEIP
jgi:formylglycine-generating enzyme required for sulfatase activity